MNEFQNNLINFLKLFKNRPYHLAKYLIDNSALTKDFYNKIIESFNMSQILGTKIISYSGPFHISGIDWWGMTTKIGDWLKAPHFLLGTTYMIMKSEKEDIINCINNVPWHSPDFWLGWICHDRLDVLVSSSPIVHQKEGYSVLDYLEK